MRAHFLQHVPFEGLGSIESWLQAAGYTITCTRFFESQNLPESDQIDLLIIMGGPMSVNDEKEFPWLVLEKKFIFDVIQLDISVLGICLGAQLIASAMGAKVYKNKTKEIGWFPIQGVVSEKFLPFNFPKSVQVFHWHGETFDLPVGAVCLANSAVCKNQAFALGKKIIGLQFHLETTNESAQQIVRNCKSELIPSEYIQTESDILAATPEQYKVINQLMDKVLSFITKS
ncbi:MAG: amidotransferase [Pseudomonadota bacterium]